MEISEERSGSARSDEVCNSKDTLSSLAPLPPPLPPPPAPQITPPLCPALPPLSGLSSVLANSRVSSTSAADERQLGRNEISTGIRKLVSWGMCNPDQSSVWLASNRHTAPVLQQGPECGIAALCMAVNMLKPHLSLAASKSEILRAAKEKGYTIQGEMFSVQNMLDLATCTCGAHGQVLHGNLEVNRNDIIDHVANGWPILVPYDKDGNCEPCCRRGHKAHWAVLTGFLLHCKRHSIPDLHSSQWQQDSTMPNLYHIISSPDALPASHTRAVQSVLETVPASDIYVLARQGKSTHCHPWSLSTLSDSNANLLELGRNIVDNIDMFVIPEGGIQAGLCSQAVFIRP